MADTVIRLCLFFLTVTAGIRCKPEPDNCEADKIREEPYKAMVYRVIAPLDSKKGISCNSQI